MPGRFPAELHRPPTQPPHLAMMWVKGENTQRKHRGSFLPFPYQNTWEIVLISWAHVHELNFNFPSFSTFRGIRAECKGARITLQVDKH